MNNNDKIFRVIELIGGSGAISQRELAQSTGFSLGLVNLIIKRLVQTGHIRIKNLDQRKVQYILTPKGLLEKTRRTYTYISQTIRTFSEYRRRIESLVRDVAGDTQQNFAIVGDGEVAPLVEMVLKSVSPEAKVRRLLKTEAVRNGETVLDCRPDGKAGHVGVSVLSQLLKEPWAHH